MRRRALGMSPRVDDVRRLGFYPLLLLLEEATGGARPGESAALAEDRIRLRHEPSLAFSTADVASVRELPLEAGDGTEGVGLVFEVTTTFLGLTGGVSPLPSYMAEEVAQEQGDVSRVGDFLDLFHHRLLGLLHLGWASNDLPNSWSGDAEDRWNRRLLALLGFDASVAGALRLDARRLLRLAPLLAGRNVTAATLALAIEDRLAERLGGARVAVEPLSGTWALLPPDQWTRLGRTGRLGRECLLGRRVMDPAGRFRVTIGPLCAASYQAFEHAAPGREVEELISCLVREPLEHDTVLWLAPNSAGTLRLGASRLSKDAWIGGQARAAFLTARALR